MTDNNKLRLGEGEDAGFEVDALLILLASATDRLTDTLRAGSETTWESVHLASAIDRVIAVLREKHDVERCAITEALRHWPDDARAAA